MYLICARNKHIASFVPIFSSKTVLLLLSFDTKFAWTNSKCTEIYFFYISAKFCNWDHIKIFIFQCVPMKVRLFIEEKVSVYKSEYLIVFFPLLLAEWSGGAVSSIVSNSGLSKGSPKLL